MHGVLPEIHENKEKELEKATTFYDDLSFDESDVSSHHQHHEPGEDLEGLEGHLHEHHHFKMTDLLFSHKSMGYQIWSKGVNFLCLISSFIYAHYGAFRHSDPELNSTMVMIELIFFYDMMLTFITTIDDVKNQGKSIRDLSKISSWYFNGEFIYDFIALIPFQFLTLHNNRQDLLYIIKLIRLRRGIMKLDIMGYL